MFGKKLNSLIRLVISRVALVESSIKLWKWSRRVPPQSRMKFRAVANRVHSLIASVTKVAKKFSWPTCSCESSARPNSAGSNSVRSDSARSYSLGSYSSRSDSTGSNSAWSNSAWSSIRRSSSARSSNMELETQISELVSIFFQWQEDHPVEDQEVRFEYLEATDTTLNFRANGMVFQLLLPPGVFESEVVPDETFIAMNLDRSAPNSLMVSLNEKLQRVPIGPSALSQGLDVFAKAMISFEGKRKRPERRSVQRPIGKGLLNDFGLAIEPSKADFDAGGEGHGNEGFNYDRGVDMGTNDCLPRWNKGDVQGMIREFISKCSSARHRSRENFLYIPFDLTYSGANLMLYVDDILQFCHVSLVSDTQVSVQIEVAGIVNDVKIASCLGLSCSKTIKITLGFDKRDTQMPLMLSHVAVDPDSGSARFSNFFDAIRVDTEIESHDEFEVAFKKFAGRQKTTAYGASVLLPELIQTFFRYKAGETTLRATRWKNKNLDEALEAFAAVDNVFIGLICFIGSQLKSLPRWCTVCWSQLPASVWRLRTCQNDLCLYEFEELGLGATIHHEIQESPEVVELELSLAYAAGSSDRDVFEPFPSSFLAVDELRGRSGWFSGPSGPLKPPIQLSPASMIKSTVTQAFGPNIAHTGDPNPRPYRVVIPPTPVAVTKRTKHADLKDNKQLPLLLDVLQSIPSLADLRKSKDEISLKRNLAEASFRMWKKKDVSTRSKECEIMCHSYDLMRFILSSNRSSLRILKGSEELELTVKPKFQFVVLHDTPEKEALFDQRRAQKGSFFAFHGSNFCNWYSILRNGLRPMSNTKYMSTGAAHGHGIYLSDSFSLSSQYARSTFGCWKNGTLKEGSILIAICEVISNSCSSSAHSIFVVPPGLEDNISVRYLLVVDSSDMAKWQSPFTIKGCVLSDPSRHQGDDPHLVDPHAVDLKEKYQRLRKADQEMQQQSLLTSRTDAFFRIKGDEPSPLSRAHSAKDWASPSSSGRSSSSASPDLEDDSPTSRSGDYFSDDEDSSSSSQPLGDGNSYSSPLKRLLSETLISENIAADARPSVTVTVTATATVTQSVPKKQKKNEVGDSAPAKPALPAAAAQAIAKEFKTVQKEIVMAKRGASSSSKGPHLNDSFLSNITIDIPDEADLSVWHVVLSQNLFTSYANLYKDLQKLATMKKQPESSVLLEVTFPGMYPFEPPFVRVVRPRFVFHTGHVTIGGSICMELLTTSGWLPSFSFESVLVQIVNAFIEGEGRVDMKALGQEYSKDEARKAFTRVAGLHGWN